MSKYENILTKEILENLYNEYKSLRKISKVLKIDRKTLQNYMIENKVAYDLKKRIPHYKAKRYYNCDHNFFSKETEEAFYWAGFIAADGCVNIHNQITLTLGIKDREHLEKFKQSLNADYLIRDRLVKNPSKNIHPSSTIKITSKTIINDLLKFNIVPNKTKIYTLPEWIKNHPLRHHFIRGYNDGDGSFFWTNRNKKTPKLKFSLLGTESFIHSVKDIIENDLQLTNGMKSVRLNKGLTVLEYSGNNILRKLVDYLYKDSNLFLNRKKDTAFKVFDLPIIYTLNNATHFKSTITAENLRIDYNQFKNINGLAKHYKVSGYLIKKYLKNFNII